MTENPKSNAGVIRTGKASKREASPLSKVLPTDRVAFDKQVEILRAFAAVYAASGGNPVSNETAGAALTPTFKSGTVITTNAFFTDVGLLVRSDEGGFEPSQELN